RQLLESHFEYYHQVRPHRSLCHDSPIPRPVESSEQGKGDRIATGRRLASSLPAPGGLRPPQQLAQELAAMSEEPCLAPSESSSTIGFLANRNAGWTFRSAPTGPRTVGRLLFSVATEF